MNIISDIPVRLEVEEVLTSLKFSKNTPYAEKMIGELIESITPVMKPKVIYTESSVQNLDDETVAIDNHVFRSKVLVKNLIDQTRCYPYIVTAGRELEEIVLPEGQSIMLLDLVKNIVVEKAFQYTKAFIVEKHGVEHVSGLSPGHLDDWPLNQQRVLFDLLGPDVAKVGVELTDAYLMKPLKTVSGILFTSMSGFQSCQVCTQSRCMGRKTGYDPNVAKLYGLTPI